MVGLAGALPGHVGVELSPAPGHNSKESEEVEEVDEAHVQEVVEEAEAEGLHADATLLVEGGGHGAGAGHKAVHDAGELGFGGGGNEIRVWHL